MKSTISLAVICLAATSQAHTWLENIRLIASNGTFIGPLGYPRGFMDRSTKGFTDENLINRLNNAEFSDKNTPMCRASQLGGKQSSEFPAVSAAPGDNIAMLYAENGHVTKLETGRPARGGMVFVYGTQKPSDSDKFNSIHRVWNAAGTGGDGRGKLIATRPYDDGQCRQASPADATELNKQRHKDFPLSDGKTDLLCQTDVQIPQDAETSGDYTLYWVWEWPILTPDGKIANAETYTQCADVKLTSKDVAAAGAFVEGQSFDQVAVPAQLNNLFLLDPSAKPALTTAPPFSMGPGSPSSVIVSTPSKQTSTTPSPSSTPVKVSTSAALPSKTSTPTKSSSSTSTSSTSTSTSTSTSSTSTTEAPSSTSPPASGFVTVTVTATPEEQKTPVATVTEYVTLSKSTPITATTTITLTPIPSEVFDGSKSSSASSTPVPTSVDGRPVVEPISSVSPSATPKPTTPGGVFLAPNLSSSSTSDAVVHSTASTTSNAVVPIPTAPGNGTVPLFGRHTRKRSSQIARW